MCALLLENVLNFTEQLIASLDIMEYLSVISLFAAQDLSLCCFWLKSVLVYNIIAFFTDIKTFFKDNLFY